MADIKIAMRNCSCKNTTNLFFHNYFNEPYLFSLISVTMLTFVSYLTVLAS